MYTSCFRVTGDVQQLWTAMVEYAPGRRDRTGCFCRQSEWALRAVLPVSCQPLCNEQHSIQNILQQHLCSSLDWIKIKGKSDAWLLSINLYKSVPKDIFISDSSYRDPKPISQIWVRTGNQKQGLFLIILLIIHEKIDKKLITYIFYMKYILNSQIILQNNNTLMMMFKSMYQ